MASRLDKPHDVQLCVTCEAIRLSPTLADVPSSCRDISSSYVPMSDYNAYISDIKQTAAEGCSWCATILSAIVEAGADHDHDHERVEVVLKFLCLTGVHE